MIFKEQKIAPKGNIEKRNVRKGIYKETGNLSRERNGQREREQKRE